MKAPGPPLAAWVALTGAPDLVEAAAAIDPADVAAVSSLRRRHDAELTAAALSLAEGRRRLRSKFPDLPQRWDRLWADRESAEQASAQRVADWKARRFAEAEGSIADLCCGLGGDAMSLARAGETIAVDQSEVRAWMTARNAGCATLVADVLAERPATRLAHLDPARRDESGGGRRRHPESFSPALETCLSMMTGYTGAALKLGPGIDHACVEAPDRELEFLSGAGSLVQAVLWSGVLAQRPGERRATLLPTAGPAVTLVGRPRRAPAAESDRFDSHLFLPDPALERAGLLGVIAEDLHLAERSPGLGILTGPPTGPTPWLTAYEVLARPRARELAVREALRALGASGARVRTRGGAVDADQWTKALRLEGGGGELDLFLLRCGDRLEAVIARAVAG